MFVLALYGYFAAIQEQTARGAAVLFKLPSTELAASQRRHPSGRAS